MLLIIEALLLILAALGQDHSAAAVEAQIYPLDIALDCVDDQYDGCRDKMTDLVNKTYINKEFQNTTDFKIAWGKAEEFVKTQNYNLTTNHSIAIYIYTDALVYTVFNNDTRNGKNQYKNETYKWYSLHFLLTEAIQILKKPNICYSTYRGTTVEFDKNVMNTTVRLGSFSSASHKREVAKHFGNVSCFEIFTCEGADVTEYSKLSREKEVLIPPYETFNVTAIKTKGQEGAWCNTVYTLNSTGTKSDLNCTAAFNKPS